MGIHRDIIDVRSLEGDLIETIILNESEDWHQVRRLILVQDGFLFTLSASYVLEIWEMVSLIS